MLGQVLHQGNGVPAEETFQEVVDGAFDDVILLDGCAKDVRLAFHCVSEIAFLLQSAKQRLDGRIGDLSLRGQSLADLLNGRVFQLPDQTQDLGLGRTQRRQLSFDMLVLLVQVYDDCVVQLYKVSRRRMEKILGDFGCAKENPPCHTRGL